MLYPPMSVGDVMVIVSAHVTEKMYDQVVFFQTKVSLSFIDNANILLLFVFNDWFTA